MSDAKSIAVAIERFLGEGRALFQPWGDVLAAASRGNRSPMWSEASIRFGVAIRWKSTTVESLISSVLGHNQEMLSKAERLHVAIELAQAGQYTHVQISQLPGVARDTIRKGAGPSPRKGRGLR